MCVLVVEVAWWVCGDAGRALGRAVALAEPGVWEHVLEGADDFWGGGCRAAGPSFHDRAELWEVWGYHGILDQTDEDGWDKDEFFDAVGQDGCEHGGQCECGEHHGETAYEDGVADEADQARDVEEWHNGQDAIGG